MMPPARDRFFEDYHPGAAGEYGPITIDESEILEFGRRYDPQYLHVDRERADRGLYGGLIASGWQTMATAMRLFVDNFLPDGASLGSPGVDELRWLRPVRPGDALRLRVTVVSTRVSKTKPDRGLVETSLEIVNQADEVVATMRAVNFIKRRPSNPSTGSG
ncbi:MAG: MaoC family dehydratase [Candidatus Eremiobacteraeota bacterium]|nr:MaoC family dehydratase [Candidatus Eremiobacteraeota bacterium]